MPAVLFDMKKILLSACAVALLCACNTTTFKSPDGTEIKNARLFWQSTAWTVTIQNGSNSASMTCGSSGSDSNSISAAGEAITKVMNASQK